MPSDDVVAAPPVIRSGILWLVVGHFVVGLIGACVAYSAGRSPTFRGATFVGLSLGQTSLLGIWGGLGTSRWWKRGIGVGIGACYLCLVMAIGIHEVNMASLIVVSVATSFVTSILLIVRFFRVAIYPDSATPDKSGPVQFSIRHLLILTLVIACLISIIRLIQPHFSHRDVRFSSELLHIALTFGVVGVLPVWFVLASRHPVIYGFILVFVGVCAGCGLGVGRVGDLEVWMTATTVAMLVVILSLFVVRTQGYRLMRLSSRPPRKK